MFLNLNGVCINNYYFYSIALQLLNEKSSFPSFITVKLSNRTQKKMDLIIEKENNKDVESNNISKTDAYEDESDKIKTGLVFNN